MTSSLKLKFGDLATVGSGYAFSSKSWISEGIPVVKIRNVQDGFVDMSECSFVSEGIAEKANKWWTREGDTLVALTGAGVGEIGRMHQGQEALVNQRVGLVKSKDPSESDYVFYLLRHNKQRIIELASGSAQPNLAPSAICELECQVAEPQKRVLIGQTLANLDLKIQINQQIASTLEQIAQTIFKSWFVDFDPVHAKARGEQPVGMDARAAALFPNSFEDSELGPIPSGWKPELLGSLVELTKGKSYKSIELEPSDVALVTLKSFKRGGGYRHDGLKAYSGKFKESQVIRSGDLIVAMTDVTQAADVVGKPAIVASTGEYSELVASLDVGIVRPKSQSATKNFLYFLFLTTEFDAQVRAHASGTTVLHLGADAIPSFPLCLPSQEVINAFSEIVNPCVAQIDSLSQQNSNLVEIRDSLLPRLISGELEIPAELLEA